MIDIGFGIIYGFGCGVLFAKLVDGAIIIEDPTLKEWLIYLIVSILWPLTLFVGFIGSIIRLRIHNGNIHFNGWNLTWNERYRELGQHFDDFEMKFETKKFTLFKYMPKGKNND